MDFTLIMEPNSIEVAMIDLEDADLYFPNTKVIRDLLVSLNYKVSPISTREGRDPLNYISISFAQWVTQFKRIQQANKAYYCMNKPTLTEEQSIFVFDILHICPDYRTFKEALHQYINNNP